MLPSLDAVRPTAPARAAARRHRPARHCRACMPAWSVIRWPGVRASREYPGSASSNPSRHGMSHSAPVCRSRPGPFTGSALGEQIAAQQGAGDVIEHEAALPGMRQMRVSNQRSACRPRTSFSPSPSACGARSATSFTETIAAMRPQTGTDSGATAQEFIERAAFVSLEMREADVVQPLGGNTPAIASSPAEHAAAGRYEEHGFVVDDQILLKLKAPPPGSSTAC